MPVSIRAEHVNPFILSNLETFAKMVGVEAKPGKPVLKQDARLDYDISGIIGLSGKVIGSVALSFPQSTALAVCNKFMSADLKEMNAEILDAVGELVNIVAGNAKKGLAEFAIEISLPSVIVGPNHRIVEPKGCLGFVIPFASALGSFHMAVSLKPA
jgi:chemotaxis protein CheX